MYVHRKEPSKDSINRENKNDLIIIKTRLKVRYFNW